jgi:hypothetical protein
MRPLTRQKEGCYAPNDVDTVQSHSVAARRYAPSSYRPSLLPQIYTWAQPPLAASLLLTPFALHCFHSHLRFPTKRFAGNQAVPSLASLAGQLQVSSLGDPIGISCLTIPPFAQTCNRYYESCDTQASESPSQWGSNTHRSTPRLTSVRPSVGLLGHSLSPQWL